MARMLPTVNGDVVRWNRSLRTGLAMVSVKASHHVLGGAVPNESDLYTEFLGFDDQIYSIFHCDLYTISVVQSSNGTVIALSYETDDEPVQEL